MKFTILALAFAVLAGIPSLASAMEKEMHADAMMAKPAVTAVVFYSDTCGSCKILEPRMASALEALNKDKIDVVKFDFSSEASTTATNSLAAEKNVTGLLNEYGKKTGFVVLLDSEGNEFDKLKVDNDTGEIAAKLAKAIATAS